MAEKTEAQIEETDDGTSLEKSIENLDKNDPDYGSKRDKLTLRLQEFRQELNKIQKDIRKQHQETRAALQLLRRQAGDNPELQHLMMTTELDKAFLTRAMAEIVSAKGNLENEMKRLKTSKDFNQPLDMKILTGLKVKPLPSSQIKDCNKVKTSVQEAKKEQSQRPMSLGKKIMMLSRAPVKNNRSGAGAPSYSRTGNERTAANVRVRH